MLPVVVTLCALLIGDWPQFRGPNSDGHAAKTATPLEWSDTKNVAWKVAVPGLGWSSPVVADGKIFLTTAVPRGAGLSLRALALDTTSGKVLWDREVRAVETAPAIHVKNSHASPTSIYRDGALFVHFGTLGMARLAASDGSIKWFCNELIYAPVHGSGGSPILQDGKLVVVCDGSSQPFVAAVDAESGRIAWKTSRSVEARISHSFATPALVEVNGKTQVIAPGPNHLAAYDLASGTELWRVQAAGWSVVPQPAIAHGLVIYNHDYDHPELLAVKLGGAGDVTESHVVWRLQRGAPSSPSPLVVGDDLYFVSDKGIASCVNAKTGEGHWSERLGGNYSASPIFANGKILFLDEDGVATWVEPGRQFVVYGRNEVPGRTFATPAFADGAMYLRTDEHLYKIAK
ncbi:MAG: PQQ-binding-like beta-propeller repeat protein [Pirellulales bacterium]|nr:PQQ-binding-like beta-propeller repeat protein [Pirellulales bacterium]